MRRPNVPPRCTENPNPDIMAIKHADECVRLNGDRVCLSGRAVTIFRGRLEV